MSLNQNCSLPFIAGKVYVHLNSTHAFCRKLDNDKESKLVTMMNYDEHIALASSSAVVFNEIWNAEI